MEDNLYKASMKCFEIYNLLSVDNKENQDLERTLDKIYVKLEKNELDNELRYYVNLFYFYL